MMKSEFIERVGFEPTGAEYADIEAEYMGTDVDKDQFCKEWKKNGGVQRLMRLRTRQIEELEYKLAMAEKKYEKMNTSHNKEVLQLKENYEGKLKTAEENYKQCHEANENLDRLLHEANVAHKEAEDKLATIRAAFAILGISKEVND